MAAAAAATGPETAAIAAADRADIDSEISQAVESSC